MAKTAVLPPLAVLIAAALLDSRVDPAAPVKAV
jgi:hypothetical protein